MEEIDELVKKIRELNYHYYTLDQPLVSDGEYDKLYDRLKKLQEETGYIPKDSPTEKVGGELLEKFQKHTHLTRLYSQDKSQTYEEVKAWIDRCQRGRLSYNESHAEKLPDLEFVVEYKFDGLTIDLTYENGKLINAATRGNGIVGEEVKAQVLTIEGIPQEIPDKGLLEIQGEALMPLSSLEKYNRENEVPLKNARNAVAGAIRNLDVNETRRRGLAAYFYNVPTNDKNFSTEMEMLNFIKDQGLPVFSYNKLVSSYDEIIGELKMIEEERRSLDILTDGVVIKINDKRTQEALGYTNKFPRWSIAFKYEPDEYTTILREVVWNVGRSGKVTPSALVDPVDFSGVTVKRATLNNYDDIQRKKLRLGSKVFIRRSNDVIPEILGVVDENQEGTEEIQKPKYCPYCGSELIQGKVHVVCPNSISCTPQLQARLVHFASRNAMDIEGLSEKTIGQMIENLGVREVDDIYDLTYDDLMSLDKFKEKKTNNLLSAIEASKEVDLPNFINALGIPNVGEKTSRDLAQRFESFQNLRRASLEDLVQVEDIGEVVAENILDYFQDKNISSAIDRLLSKGIKIREGDFSNKSSDLEGLTFVITGTIEGYKRDDLKILLEDKGAKAAGSVSKNTDYLLAGEKAGSKRDKAEELGIKILEDKELYDFLEKLENN